MEVTAKINISSPTGRRLVRELEKHTKVVELEYPIDLNLIPEGSIPLAMGIDQLWKSLQDKLGYDLREK
jgi:hypothetical protein